jgi:Uma2 family endonuclease
MKQANIRFTYRDYLQLPDDKRYELVEGEFFLVPAPSLYHQQILGKLWTSIYNYAKANRLGEAFLAPCDVVLCETTVVQPDLVFVSDEHRGILTEANIQGPPDLVVEILSPSTGQRDLGLKRNLYARYGVREYWIVDPDAGTIEVLALTESGYRPKIVVPRTGMLNSILFPTLNLPLADIF